MPACSAVPVELTASERHRLKKMAYGHKTPYQTRQRATIVLLAARGCSNARIATETRLHVDTVRRWRGRFAVGRVPALADRKRSGRPPTFTGLQVAEVKALACQLSAESKTPLSRWSCPELARGRHPGHHQDDLRLHSTALAQGRRPQALATPLLDLHSRPELPRHGPTSPGPVCAHLRRRPARRRSPGPAPSIRRPLQRHGTAVPVEVHHHRPGRSAGQTRPAHTDRPTGRILHRTRSMINPRRTSGGDH